MKKEDWLDNDKQCGVSAGRKIMSIHEIHGEWDVVSDSRELITEIGDFKAITVNDYEKEGKSVLPADLGGEECCFYVEIKCCDQVVLNYDHPKNPFFFKGIREYLTKVSDGWDGTLKDNGVEMFSFRLKRHYRGSGIWPDKREPFIRSVSTGDEVNK